jgi:Zn-dependent protease
LLPGYPLDGGSIAQAVLVRFMRRSRARLITGYIGLGIAGLLVLLGLSGAGFGYTVLVGLMLGMAAWQEVEAVKGSRF